MTESSQAAVRRANRLVRCYPREWRARYGEEFTQLLITPGCHDGTFFASQQHASLAFVGEHLAQA